MPFTKHIIEPTNISQCPLPPGEPNELECLSNLTLANVIRQLSSLGQHAGRIFDDLSKDALKLNQRTQVLHQRIESLKQKCSQLDIQNDEVSLHDFQTKKQFKSSIKIDQQVVSRKTMPEAIRLMYEAADAPPELDKLNPYRNDGKDCMKFYTDPEFFFNIWCNELMKDNEIRKVEKKKRRTKGDKNVKSPQQQKQQQHQQQILTGQENHNPNMILQQQQIQYEQQQQHQQQQQLLLLNQQNNTNGLKMQQPNLGILSSTQNHMTSLLTKITNGNHLNYCPQNGNHQKDTNNQEYDDQILPPPPTSLQQNLNGYQVYAESTSLNNGIKMNKINIQQANLALSSNNNNSNNNNMNVNERPVFPPPPIPDSSNRLSDLQQIQQQLIRKYDTNSSTNDLPPPPTSPPTTLYNDGNAKVNLVAISMNNLTLTQKVSTNGNLADMTDSVFDMPLPPPPLELQDNINTNNNHHSPTPPPPPPLLQANNQKNNNNNHHNSLLPPPPPLPPLVESDTASSSTSSPNCNTMNNISSTNNNNTSKAPSEEPPTKTNNNSNPRSFLDDINSRRYVLKPTQKENLDQRTNKMNNINNNNTSVSNGSDENAIQPFVNNSDVAAIIDFIRKFRPHVRDSSDDEENSDWDD